MLQIIEEMEKENPNIPFRDLNFHPREKIDMGTQYTIQCLVFGERKLNFHNVVKGTVVNSEVPTCSISASTTDTGRCTGAILT